MQSVDHVDRVETSLLEQRSDLLVELLRRQVVRQRQIVEGIADDEVVLPGRQVPDRYARVLVVGHDSGV